MNRKPYVNMRKDVMSEKKICTSSYVKNDVAMLGATLTACVHPSSALHIQKVKIETHVNSAIDHDTDPQRLPSE